MSEKGAKKKDAKPVIISGTSKKPLLNDEPINMADTNEYVMHYTDIFGTENGTDVVDIQEGDAISESSDTEIVGHSIEHTNYEDHSDSDNESDGEYREGPPPLPDSDDETDTIDHHHSSLPAFTGIDIEDDVGEWDYEGPQPVLPVDDYDGSLPPLPTADSDSESSIHGSASPPPVQSADSDYESNVIDEQENGEQQTSTTESERNIGLDIQPSVTSQNSDQNSDAGDCDIPSPVLSGQSDQESDAKEEQVAGEEVFQDAEEEQTQVFVNDDEKTLSAEEVEQTEITNDVVDSASGEEGENSGEEVEKAENIEESDDEKCDDQTDKLLGASLMNTQVNHATSDDDNVDEGSDVGEQTAQNTQEIIKEEKSKLELISQEISIDSDAEDEKQTKEDPIPFVKSQVDDLELDNSNKMETKSRTRDKYKKNHHSKNSTEVTVAKSQKGKLHHKYPGTAVKADSEEPSVSSPISDSVKKDTRTVSSRRSATPTTPTEWGKTGNKKGLTNAADAHTHRTTHKKPADQGSSVGRVETNKKEKHRTKPQKMSASSSSVSSKKDETLKEKPVGTEAAKDLQQTKIENEEPEVESKPVVTRSELGRKHERRSMSSRLAAVTAESNADKPTEHAQKKVTPSRTVSPPLPRDETVTKGDHKSKTSRPASSSNVSVDSKPKPKPSRSSSNETNNSAKASLSLGTEAKTKPPRSATNEADVKQRSHVNKTNRSVGANSKSSSSTGTETTRRDCKQRPSKMASVGTETVSAPELKPHQPEPKVKTRNKDVKSESKKTKPSSVSIAVGTDDDMCDGEYNGNDDEVVARRSHEVQKASFKRRSQDVKKNGEPYHSHPRKEKPVQRNLAHEKQRKHEHVHHQKHDRKKHVWLCRDDEIHKLIAQKASMLKEYESGSLAGRKSVSGRRNADNQRDISGIPDVGFAGKKPKNARAARPVSELVQENRLQKKEKRRSLQHFYSDSSSEDEDERTNRSAANQQKAPGTFAVGIASRKFVKEPEHEDESDHEETCEYCMAEKAEREAKKKNPAWEGPHHPRNLLLGVVYSSKYLGSTQIMSPQSPNRAIRMQQAQEAMGRIKVPEGEDQPTTDVDVFISTERLKVVNAASKEVMMDHGLRNVSFIADIGDILVLMARRDAAEKDKDVEMRPSQILASIGSGTTDRETIKITCHVFQSEEAQLIAKSIGQAFNVAYQEFLKKNGLSEENIEDAEYSGVLEAQKILGEDLSLLADESKAKEVVVNKKPAEMLGVMIVESGWGSMIPTAIIAHLAKDGAAAKSGQLNVGDQILAVNGTSFVGLPLTDCQTAIKNTRPGTKAVLKIVSCPPTVQVSVNRPDTKYQLGFSVQNGMICSLMRGSIAERGGVRVGHRIIEINGESVVATSHQRIVELLATTVGEIRMKTMPAAMYRLLVGLDTPIHI